MALQILTDTSKPLPRFLVRSDDAQPFKLTSLLVVSANDGSPIWEITSSEFEPTDLEFSGAIFGVMTEPARNVLNELQQHSARASNMSGQAPTHLVLYGSTPEGFRQTLPSSGEVPLLAAQTYRVVIFSSSGSASQVFDITS